MKKVIFEIPEWAEERHLFLLAGQECIAMQYAGEDDIYIKTGQCVHCQQCCLGFECEHASPKGCKLVASGKERYVNCCIDAPREFLKNVPECTMRYKVK
ncbi:MAG: hypothetical protein ACW99J_20710 [Candidatus Thorarchaeota archaeon]|jgi:hypothetical protein